MIHEVRLPLAWHFIERVRETASEALASAPEELCQATVMAASELAENVVKYGRPLGEDDTGRITVSAEPAAVVVRSESGATAEQARRALDVIDAVRSTEDIAALYVARLTTMATETNDKGSELGLLRVAFEGRFALSGSFDGRLLISEATRSIP